MTDAAVIIRVKGVTLKGKNRVNTDGDLWFVIGARNGRRLLKSVKTGYHKWGPDPDFEQIFN